METIYNERGNLRARLEVDMDAGMPWGDVQGHVYAVDHHYDYGWRADLQSEGKGSAPDLSDALARWSPTRDQETLERYLRAFHDVVSVAWYSRRSGGFHLELVTRDMADAWGVEPAADLANLSEWEAWDEGDVYGYVVEERVTWDRVTPPRLGSDSRTETWEEVSSCWGFYGHEYAEQSAREALADADV